MIKRIAITSVTICFYFGNAFAYESKQNFLIKDGDSIRMEIRINGMDTPELYQKCLIDDKCVPCGKIAAQYLNLITEDKLISCTAKTKDKFGRFVSTCFADGKDIGKEMVRAGWAVIDPRFSQEYIKEQEEAKLNKRGLWAGKFINPWEWRKNRKKICSSK